MKHTILCSALLALWLSTTQLSWAQTRKLDNGEMNAMEEFDWETEVEIDMDLGEDGVPAGFDLVVTEALQPIQEEEENWDSESMEEDVDVYAASFDDASSSEDSEMAFGSVDPLTVEFYEDFEAYFDNFDGNEWTDDLLEGNASDEDDAEINEEALKPLREAIDNLEFQMEADWDTYSKDEPSQVSVDF
jgi:hypothetical protein